MALPPGSHSLFEVTICHHCPALCLTWHCLWKWNISWGWNLVSSKRKSWKLLFPWQAQPASVAEADDFTLWCCQSRTNSWLMSRKWTCMTSPLLRFAVLTSILCCFYLLQTRPNVWVLGLTNKWYKRHMQYGTSAVCLLMHWCFFFFLRQPLPFYF